MDTAILIDWSAHFQFRGCLVYFIIIILFLIEIHVCTQCRPWSDAAFCGNLGLYWFPMSLCPIWAGSSKLKWAMSRVKPVFWDFRPGKTQIRLLTYRSQLASWNFGWSKCRYYLRSKKQRRWSDCTDLRGCAGWSAPLLFAYVINRFYHDVVQMVIDNQSCHCDW